jgi:hypothetical protein
MRSWRPTIGIAVVGVTLIVIGLPVFPFLLFPKDRAPWQVRRGNGEQCQLLAERLRFSMTDQDITDEVAKQ